MWHIHHPAVLEARQVRRQAVHLQRMLARFALPAGTAAAQQQVTGINIAVAQVNPGSQAKTGAVQPGIIPHPAAQPRTHIHVIGLHPDAAIIQQAIAVIKIEPYLNHAVLAGKARQADFTFCPMAGFLIQPGESRNSQLGMLPGRGTKTNGAVTQVEVVKLAQEQFIDLRRPEAVLLFVAVQQRAVAVEMQLPESEVAELPAPVQQGLPDVERQIDAGDGQLAVFLQIDAEIPDLQSGAKILPLSLQLTGVNRHAGAIRDELQKVIAIAVEMRHHQTQPADQQRDNHDDRGDQQ